MPFFLVTFRNCSGQPAQRYQMVPNIEDTWKIFSRICNFSLRWQLKCELHFCKICKLQHLRDFLCKKKLKAKNHPKFSKLEHNLSEYNPQHTQGCSGANIIELLIKWCTVYKILAISCEHGPQKFKFLGGGMSYKSVILIAWQRESVTIRKVKK